MLDKLIESEVIGSRHRPMDKYSMMMLMSLFSIIETKTKEEIVDYISEIMEEVTKGIIDPYNGVFVKDADSAKEEDLHYVLNIEEHTINLDVPSINAPVKLVHIEAVRKNHYNALPVNLFYIEVEDSKTAIDAEHFCGEMTDTVSLGYRYMNESIVNIVVNTIAIQH